VPAAQGRGELMDASGWQGSLGRRNRDGVLSTAARKCSTPAPDQQEEKGEWKALKCPHPSSMAGAERCGQVTKG